MEVLKGICLKFKLPFYRSGENNILDEEFNTAMSRRLKNLKAGHIMNKEEGNKFIRDIKTIGRRLGNLEDYIKKKQEADEIEIEEAISILKILKELEGHITKEEVEKLKPAISKRLDFLEEDHVEKEDADVKFYPSVHKRLDFLEEDHAEKEEDSNYSIRVTLSTFSKRLRMLEECIKKDEEDRIRIRTDIKYMFGKMTELREHIEMVPKSMEKLWEITMEVKNSSLETRSMSENAFEAADVKFRDLSYQIQVLEERISTTNQLQPMPNMMPFHHLPAIIPLQRTPTMFQLRLSETPNAGHGPASTDASHNPASTEAGHNPTSADAGHDLASTNATHSPASTNVNHDSASMNACCDSASTNAGQGLTSTNVSHDPSATSKLDDKDSMCTVT